MRVAYHGAVFGVDNSVAIVVYKDQVAWLRGGSIHLWTLVCIDLSLVLKHACSFVSIEIAHGLAHLGGAYHLIAAFPQDASSTVDDAVGIVNFLYFILVVGNVPIDAVIEVAAHQVVPVQCKLNTTILHLSTVDCRRIGPHAGQDGCSDKQIGSRAHVEVKLRSQTICQESCIKAEVERTVLFPCKVRVDHLISIRALALGVHCITKSITSITVVGGDERQVLKWRDRVVTIDTIGGTQFEEVDEAVVTGKVLVGHNPTCRKRWISVPTVTAGKHRRAIGAQNKRS